MTICVGWTSPCCALLDPDTLEVAGGARPAAAKRERGNPFQDFSGGGYFYLDNHDRAVISAGNRHILVIRETGGAARVSRSCATTTSRRRARGDAMISALPDWHGRIWFASTKGVVGTVEPARGAVRAIDTGEPIGNSFAVDETGGVYIVTDKAMYRFDARGTAAGRHLAAHVPEHRRREAGADARRDRAPRRP